MRMIPSVLLMLLGCACAGSPASNTQAENRYRSHDQPHSLAADRTMLTIPAGSYIAGSTPEEREQAYIDYRTTAGHDAARNNAWFAREEDRHVAKLPAFRVDQHPVTNAAYAEFVRATAARPPSIDAQTWRAQGFIQDYQTQVVRYNWSSDTPPPGREEHPVVLVTWEEARAYCEWRSTLAGETRRLPTAAEYEKAARGEQGLIYPWGTHWDADKLNSQVRGPLDTVPVGNFAEGASPYGMLDAAGNVFQWTATPWPHRAADMTVKGSAWDDYAGVGRGASMHGRPATARHVLVGLRCAASLGPE